MVAVIALTRHAWAKCRAEWAGCLAGLYRPVEAVLLPFAADEFCGVDLLALPVIILRIDVGMHGSNHRQLVAANGAGEDLLLSRRHIKVPASGDFDYRDRQLPTRVANVEMGNTLLFDNLMLHRPVAVEAGDSFGIDLLLRQKLPPVIAQHGGKLGFVLIGHRVGKGTRRLI